MNERMAFGIDFGTSTSEISYFHNGTPKLVVDPGSRTRSPIVPSLISIDRSGNLVVGDNASARVDLPGYGVREVKRLLGSGKTVRLHDTDYRPEELAAVMMKYLKLNAERVLGQQVTDVVLSVPAMFPDHARQATLNAGRLAGLNIISLINEPTAAALAFGINNLDADEEIVVFDFGGGTLDITVLDMAMGVIDVRATYGEPYLGGKDFDDLMLSLIMSKFSDSCPGVSIDPNAAYHLNAEAEKAKIALSALDSTWVYLPSFAADSRRQPVDLEVEITRAEFERASSGLLSRARECIDNAMVAAKVDMRSISRVLLVGGTTYIPAVRQIVCEAFRQIPRTDIDPDLAVAMGACTKAAVELGLIEDSRRPILADVAPYGLGINIVTHYGAQPTEVYDPLISPNQPIPYSVSRDYTLLYEDQESLEVGIFQSLGSRRCPVDSPEVVDIDVRGRIENIPPSQTGQPHAVQVDFTYGTDGIVHLRALIPATGQSVDLGLAKVASRMDDADMEDSQIRVDALWMQSPRYRGCKSLIERAEKVLQAGTHDLCGELRLAVAALKAALEDGGESRIDDCEDRLTDLLMQVDGDS